jgi:transcriptional regulator of acetoin/glycerol metabolism
MAVRDKNPNLPPAPTFAPISHAVLETLEEGVAVFDAHARLVYANERARRVIDGLGDAAQRGDALRERLLTLGGRARPLKHSATELGEVVFLPTGDQSRTLAEQERQAILDALDVTQGKLAEAARRLGISRTTLWRRLRAYGLRPDEGSGHGPAVRA